MIRGGVVSDIYREREDCHTPPSLYHSHHSIMKLSVGVFWHSHRRLMESKPAILGEGKTCSKFSDSESPFRYTNPSMSPVRRSSLHPVCQLKIESGGGCSSEVICSAQSLYIKCINQAPQLRDTTPACLATESETSKVCTKISKAL